MLKLINSTSDLISDLIQTSDERMQMRLVNKIKRNRKRIYKEFTRDGTITEHEQSLLNKLDTAWVEATIKLGKL